VNGDLRARPEERQVHRTRPSPCSLRRWDAGDRLNRTPAASCRRRRIADDRFEIDHASYMPLVRIHWFNALRFASPSGVKYAAPSYGVSVAP